MAQVQIKNKWKTIDIMSGEEKLGEIKFNPDDTRTYSRFIELIETLTNGKRDIDGVEFDTGELQKPLDSLEDFEKASDMFEKMKKITGIAIDTWESVCKGLDEIFGAGVCDIFTQGSLDPELLMPLIDAVMPFFKEARQEKAKPYLKNV